MSSEIGAGSERSGSPQHRPNRPALSFSEITDQRAVKIWSAMVGLGKPSKDSPTLAQIREALKQALEDAVRVCHYCELPIEDGERAIRAKTGNGWAHVTCWYDGGPFERELRERG